MVNDSNPEIESSPLCGSVTRDGITVRVEIYRIAGRGEGWALEVIDGEGASTVWDDTFADDQDAYDEFYRALELEGISLPIDEYSPRGTSGTCFSPHGRGRPWSRTRRGLSRCPLARVGGLGPTWQVAFLGEIEPRAAPTRKACPGE